MYRLKPPFIKFQFAGKRSLTNSNVSQSTKNNPTKCDNILLFTPKLSDLTRALKFDGDHFKKLGSRPIPKKQLREIKRILENSWEMSNIPNEELMPDEPLVGDNFFQFSALLDDRVTCKFPHLVPKYMVTRTEIQTWSDYFFRKNGVRPQMVDVDRTGIPWLQRKFRDYVLYRHLMEKSAKKNAKRALQYAKLRLTFRDYSTEPIQTLNDSTVNEENGVNEENAVNAVNEENESGFDLVDRWLMDYSMYTIQLDSFSKEGDNDGRDFHHGIGPWI